MLCYNIHEFIACCLLIDGEWFDNNNQDLEQISWDTNDVMLTDAKGKKQEHNQQQTTFVKKI